MACNIRIALFFSTSGHSGVDRSVALLIPELCQRGYQVDLLKVRKHGPYFEHPKLNVIDLGTSHTMTAFSAVKNYLKKYQPDALLSDKDRCNRVALLAKKSSKTKTRIVVSSGTIMSENLKNRSWLEVILHKLSMNQLYPKAHNIITPSIDAAKDLTKVSRLTLNQISVVPLPIIFEGLHELAEEPADHPWLKNREEPVIISVGELTARKDQSTQLKALANLSSKYPCRLLVLGKGKDLEKLQQLAKDLDIENRVDFIGYETNPYKFIKQADVFIHTATFEGFGMVLVEALSLGTPAVSTACIGGPPEILEDGKLGHLVPVGDAEALARAIEKTLTNPPSSAEDRMASVKKYTSAASAESYLRALGF